MFFIALFILVLFVLTVVFVWLAENPGAVTVTWPWLGSVVEISLLQAFLGLAILGALFTIAWMLVWGVLTSPKTFGRWRAGRRRDKGYEALSKGLVAAGAGNAPLARKLTRESSKFLENEPLVALLDAQTALLEGNRSEARAKFETMLETPDTRLLGLRGLYVEAEQEGAAEAAAHFAKEANKLAPSTPWASKAVLKAQVLEGDWEAALKTLGLNHAAKLVTKEEFNRKRAVLLTALAMEEEPSAPERAKGNGLAAHKLAPDLIPAALIAARAAKRLGDPRKAAKVLETSWKNSPHPEIAIEYVNLRLGDSPRDRVKHAQDLAKKQPDNFESHYIVAQTALDCEDFKLAREAMEKAFAGRPTERACLLMADIEEAEHGDRGRVREWLSRAVTAAKDPAWTADGVVSETWAPFSPVSGRLDAFEWKVPVEQFSGASLEADYSRLVNEPLPKPDRDEAIADDDLTAVIDVTPGKIETVEEVSFESDEDERPRKTMDKSSTEKADNKQQPEKPATSKQPSVKPHDSSFGETVEHTVDAVSVGGSVGAVAAGAAGIAVAAVAEEVSEVRSAFTGDPLKKEAPLPKAEKPAIASPLVDKKPSEKSGSPFRNANFDEDDDGVIDHRPDDPGVNDDDEEPRKKGLFF